MGPRGALMWGRLCLVFGDVVRLTETEMSYCCCRHVKTSWAQSLVCLAPNEQKPTSLTCAWRRLKVLLLELPGSERRSGRSGVFPVGRTASWWICTSRPSDSSELQWGVHCWSLAHRNYWRCLNSLTSTILDWTRSPTNIYTTCWLSIAQTLTLS